MTFTDFLKNLKKIRNIATTKELYSDLGGSESLGISLPYFQQIESGVRPPSSLLFSSLFRIVSQSEKRALIIAYIESSVDQSGDITNFLNKYLKFPELETPSKWDQSSSLSYSDQQLNELLSDSDALRTYIKILLLESCELSSFKKREDILIKLKNLNLIEIKKGKVFPYGIAYLLPTLESDSKTRSRRLGSEYVLEILDLFLEREGTSNQELRYGLQFVDKQSALQILEEVKALRNRFFSMATTDPDLTKKVPAIFVGFAKILKIEELD